jgi:hypothetical protein
MDIKDIESGTSHIANEVLLLLCNDRKWHDSWVDYVAFIKTSDFYDRWPHKAVDLMAVDLFYRMHDAGALDGLGEDAILADHFMRRVELSFTPFVMPSTMGGCRSDL